MFQSTHSRGVRLQLDSAVLDQLQFQSTHSRGVRPLRLVYNIVTRVVSIHALTRSATPRPSQFVSNEMFQSTHSRGVRRVMSNLFNFESVFQSTHSRGVRPFLKRNGIYSDLFQSTHSRGVRRSSLCIVCSKKGFQSTHSRGVRPKEKPFPIDHTCFNPRTHEECDLYLLASGSD